MSRVEVAFEARVSLGDELMSGEGARYEVLGIVAGSRMECRGKRIVTIGRVVTGRSALREFVYIQACAG